jgi:hypothetical protein
MAKISFDERKHQYSAAGRKLISVTQAIQAAGLVPEELHNEEAAQRGQAVHFACALYDHGDMANLKVYLGETKEYGTEGFLDGWVAFLKQSKFKVELIEHQIYDAVHRYAGRLDRKGKLNKQEAVVDIKSNKQGRVWPTAGIQMAGYVAPLLNGKKFTRYLRVAVCLKPDGTYSCVEYKWQDYQSDLQDFYTILRTARIRQRLGLA